jgi:hypothetical protein
MTGIPAPVLLAFAILILWPAAQIATLLLFKMRVQELAVRTIGGLGHQQILVSHVPIWAKVVGGALLAFSFVIASHHQLKTILEKGLF